MGGGGGGYHRPPGNSGSRGNDESDDHEPGVVPEPKSDDEGISTDKPDTESEDSDDNSDDVPESSVPTDSGGCGGPSVIGPVADDTPSDSDNSDSEEEEENSDHQEDDHNNPGHDRDNEEHDTNDGDDDDDDDDEDEDECLIAETALLHSPNPEPIEEATEGEINSVLIRDRSVCVVDAQGRTLGAIAEPWVDTIKQCIKQGRRYRAQILEIDGGKCVVSITNKCLLNQNVDLRSVNSAVQGKLHPELSFPIKKISQEVVIVTADGTHVGKISDPWAKLLSDCIDHGQMYHAEILDMAPDYCRINLQNGPVDE